MNEEQLTKIIQLLEETLKWTKFEGIQKVKSTLETLLTNDVEKVIYQNSDGRTSREIAVSVGSSHSTITRYWKRWATYGIVEEVKSQGGSRYKRVFSLPDFGIDIPDLEKQTNLSVNTPEPRSLSENGE
jgi:response regulator of citrate/malate metabolism